MNPAQTNTVRLQQTRHRIQSQPQACLAHWAHGYGINLLITMVIFTVDVPSTLLLHHMMRVAMCNSCCVQQSLDCMLATLSILIQCCHVDHCFLCTTTFLHA